MQVQHLMGIDTQTGRPILAATFDADEGDCCGDVLICGRALDPVVPGDDVISCLTGNHYGTANGDLPLESIPETGGKCYYEWLTCVADRWEQYTEDQKNQVFIIAHEVYPDANLYEDLNERI